MVDADGKGEAGEHGPAEASARITCVHADRCGGCPIIGLSYDEQLHIKHGRVLHSAHRYPSLASATIEPALAASPITQYRTRAKLIVAGEGKLGLFAKGGGHHVVDIPECRVLSPALAAVARVLRERVQDDERTGGPLAPADDVVFEGAASELHVGPLRRAGALRAIDLREVVGPGGPRVLVTLVMLRNRAPSRDVLEAAALGLSTTAPAIAGVAVNFHDGNSPQILGHETVVLHGVSAADDRIGETSHKATYGSFVQAHRGQAERIHAALVRRFGIDAARTPRTRVLDLYGGSGAIALALAKAGADVRLVESFAPAAHHAEQAARENGLSVRAEASDAASALRRFVTQGVSFDAVVVNPPRRGTSPAARELVARLDAKMLAYVSCDPDTLARDLDHFRRLGWVAASLQPIDMIPLTDEVETLAFLHRGDPPAPDVAYEDDDILVVDKSAHEPTMPQGEYASSLLARARLLPGASSAVAVHRLDVGTSGLVVLARTPKGASLWQSVMASDATRKIYVAGVRGITPGKGAITRDLREDGKLYPTRTRYRRLAVASGHSILRVIPEGGRTHQARRHLAAIGHPVLGDDRYGHLPTNRFFEEKNALDRTFLHCVRLEFDHPKTRQRMIIETPIPGDLRTVLERTSGPGTLKFLEKKQALGQSGLSMLPPAPDSMHDASEALDVDARSLTMHPEMITGDDG